MQLYTDEKRDNNGRRPRTTISTCKTPGEAIYSSIKKDIAPNARIHPKTTYPNSIELLAPNVERTSH